MYPQVNKTSTYFTCVGSVQAKILMRTYYCVSAPNNICVISVKFLAMFWVLTCDPPPKLIENRLRPPAPSPTSAHDNKQPIYLQDYSCRAAFVSTTVSFFFFLIPTAACESGVGSTSASDDKRSRLMLATALVELNRCSLCLRPPKKKQHPNTSSMLLNTDPSSEAWS